MDEEEQAPRLAQPPHELGKSLRCCVPCRLVKTFEQFHEEVSLERVKGCSWSPWGRRQALAAWWRPASHRCRRRQRCRRCYVCWHFAVQGCENCGYLDMAGDRERVYDCTTSEFKVGGWGGAAAPLPCAACGRGQLTAATHCH